MDQYTATKAAHFATIVNDLLALGKAGNAGDYAEPVIYSPGVQISIPEGMSDSVAIDTLTQYVADKRTMTTVIKDDYGYKPWDVAAAVARVLAAQFGITTQRGRGSQVEVQCDIDKVLYVPWGEVQVPQIKAVVTIDSTDLGDGMGMVGRTTIELPKLFEDAARGVHQLVATELSKHSIYRNKAITSDEKPRFLNPYVTDRNNIVWSASTRAALMGSVINIIRHSDRAKERGIDLNRPVLWYGEPGNGKTETMNIVAQEALENGWSFIQCNGTLRDLVATLRYARRQGRHVVAVEDFERLVNDASQQDRTDLLEELDGATSKGSEVLLIATTNFLDDLNVHQAARRRFFKEIHFGPLDAQGVENLLRITLSGTAAADAGNSIPAEEHQRTVYADEDYTTMDYAKVTRRLDGWGNSYIRKVQEFAQSIALAHETPHLTTADLLDAIEAYQPDWDAYLASSGRAVERTFESEFRKVVQEEAKQAASIALEENE
jgi:hypothetical protein